MILAVRIILGNLVCGTVAAMLYSAAGGLCCLAVLCLLRPVVPQAQSWVLGILGAMAHILGQMAVAVYVAGTGAVLLYLPVLLLAAMITGAVTGLAVTLTLQRLPPA
jgi:heptaprenyl diphosphate synthase